MKIRFITLAAAFMLGMLAVGCQKEKIVGQQNTILEAGTVYTVQYAINGILHQETLNNESECDSRLMRLFALARNGYEVEFWDTGRIQNSAQSKEKVVYKTNDAGDAMRWSKEKMQEGYQVTVSYDQETGEYTCIAIR